jgi:hypothetical protein
VTHASDAAFLERKLGRQFGEIETELPQHDYQFVGIRGADGYSEINVVRRARVAVKSDRIAANQQILDFMVVRQFQELFEVGR